MTASERVISADDHIDLTYLPQDLWQKRLGLLKDLPAKLEEEILPYFKEGVESGIFPDAGGGERAAKNDLEFFRLSGALKGDNLKIEDFWTFAPLEAALAKVK